MHNFGPKKFIIIIKKTHSERETMKIGVIGYGNMGSMIVNNILKLNLLLDDEELIVSNRHLNKFESLIEEYPEENTLLQITKKSQHNVKRSLFPSKLLNLRKSLKKSNLSSMRKHTSYTPVQDLTLTISNHYSMEN